MSWSFNREMRLPDGVMCSCGRRGDHEITDDCPKEGVNYHPEWIEEFDPTVLRYHVEDDPITDALLDQFITLRHSYMAMRTMMVVASIQRSEAEKTLRKELDQQKEQNRKLSVKWQESDKAVADFRVQVVQLQDRLAQMRTLFEEVASHIGLVKPREGVGIAHDPLISEESWQRVIKGLGSRPLDTVEHVVKEKRRG